MEEHGKTWKNMEEHGITEIIVIDYSLLLYIAILNCPYCHFGFLKWASELATAAYSVHVLLLGPSCKPIAIDVEWYTHQVHSSCQIKKQPCSTEIDHFGGA